VNEARGIAALLAHGLLRASCVAPVPSQALRDLPRTRTHLIRAIVQHQQRLQQVREDAKVKLAAVLSQVLGASGRRRLKAMIAGEAEPEKLAAVASPARAAWRQRLSQARPGRLTAPHRCWLTPPRPTIEQLAQVVAQFQAPSETARPPWPAAIEPLLPIPGVSKTAAQVILAASGPALSCCPRAGPLRSWAGLCPTLNQSAGKVMSRRWRQGAPWLKTLLVQCAWAAAHSKHHYLHAQCLRLRARRGPTQAVVAVAASILTLAYHLLRDHAPSRDLGSRYFTRLDQDRTAQPLARRIRQLGYEVQISKAA